MAVKKKVAIIGTNGIPARYGGFETLAENLILNLNDTYDFTVYCSNIYKKHERLKYFKNARLIYFPLKANGIQSVLFDIFNTFHAWVTSDVLVVLGPAAGFILPLNKLFRTNLIVNHGGLNEWEREKLSFLQRKYAYYNHKLAAKSANTNIADNLPLQVSLTTTFNIKANVVEYGGDHVVNRNISDGIKEKYKFLSHPYDLSISRSQQDNNLHILLNAYSKIPNRNLVLISNWQVSDYGKKLKINFQNKYPNVFVINAIYNKEELDVIRTNTSLYVHSHSQCGTAPSLVEAMNYNIPVICFDVATNRETTKNKTHYFKDESSLIKLVCSLTVNSLEEIKQRMLDIAKENYSWKIISKKYKEVIDQPVKNR
jgi:glycosyltransferase involved in cell wall biosynthesis